MMEPTASDLIYQALKQLNATEQRLSYALEATLEGLWDWDVPTGTLYITPRFEEMLGFSPGFLPKSPSALLHRLHPEELSKVRADYQDLVEGNRERLEIEHRLLTAKGDWIWVLSRAKVVDRIWSAESPKGSSASRIVGTLLDISAKVVADYGVRLSHATLEHMSDALVILEPNETIYSVNPAFVQSSGYTTEQLIGKHISLLKSGRHLPEFFEEMRKSLRDTGHWKGEIWNRRATGECFLEWLNVTVLKGSSGDIRHYVCIYSDLSNQEHVKTRLHDLAYYDTLTQLANSAMFRDRLANAIASAKAEKRNLAVVLIDLSRFAIINETLGYQTGDLLLVAVADRLKNSVGDDYTIARVWGDQFAIIVPSRVLENTLPHIIAKETITLLGTTPFGVAGQSISITACIGISLYPQNGGDTDSVLGNANLALTQAKKAGPDSFEIASPTLQQGAHERFQIATDLKLAIVRGGGEFRIHFQPFVDFKDKTLSGAEVLVRWQPPHVGLIPPGHFLPVAEELGMIASIDAWVLRAACQQIMQWRKMGFLLPRIAVNLSGAIIRHSDLVASVRKVLEETELEAECLELEVSEGFIMARTEKAVPTLGELRDMGISLAIDDFGTGYSSLSYLRRLPLNHLKIDQSFVRGVPKDGHDASITRAIIALGKSLNLSIIAEGIEEREHWEFLEKEGCDEGQGYFLGRPMAPENFLKWVEKNDPNYLSGGSIKIKV
ncbi:diguanylate cyclase [Gammaproteobacteria bacterium]